MLTKFEQIAKKRGYSLDKNLEGKYEDNWLQEAWEIYREIVEEGKNNERI